MGRDAFWFSLKELFIYQISISRHDMSISKTKFKIVIQNEILLFENPLNNLQIYCVLDNHPMPINSAYRWWKSVKAFDPLVGSVHFSAYHSSDGRIFESLWNQKSTTENPSVFNLVPQQIEA